MSLASARRGRVYELFVLGELTAGPHHGYLLHEILGNIIGPFRRVSWGALYPLIHRLNRAGLIAPVTAKAASAPGPGHARLLYRITPAGRQRFRALMLEQTPYAAYDTDVFNSKLGYFDQVDPPQQAQILAYHRDYLLAEEAHIQASVRGVMAATKIPALKRARIQWMAEFRLKRIQAELDWVAEALNDVR